MKKLSLALPNGSLEKQVLSMLALAGINITKADRQFSAMVDHPLIGEATFMRPQHMPQFVAEGRYDFGICGLDLYAEWYWSVRASTHQLAGQCKVSGRFTGARTEVRPTKVVAIVSVTDPIAGIKDLPQQARILSEYPAITRCWLRGAGQNATAKRVEFSYGSTEAHVPRDFRLGICMTDSGKTLAANGLRVLEEILQTAPVLIGNIRAFHNSEQARALRRLFVEAEVLFNHEKEEKPSE